jgi:RNA 2',3'-cyclic 3'-phosphodiesterase
LFASCARAFRTGQVSGATTDKRERGATTRIAHRASILSVQPARPIGSIMSESQTLPGLERPSTDSLRNVFFALRPNESIIDSIVAAGDAIEDVHRTIGRRLKRHRLHLTLLYLDRFPTIPETYLRHAIEAGDEIAAGPFDLVLDSAGSFHDHDTPWWLGCSIVPPAMIELHRRLYTGMHIRGEKARGGTSLTPHVTISRANKQALPAMPIASIRWRVDEICLIDSVMSKHEFDIVKTWQLCEPSNG